MSLVRCPGCDNCINQKCPVFKQEMINAVFLMKPGHSRVTAKASEEVRKKAYDAALFYEQYGSLPVLTCDEVSSYFQTKTRNTRNTLNSSSKPQPGIGEYLCTCGVVVVSGISHRCNI